MRKTARENAFKLVFEGLLNDGGSKITYKLLAEPLNDDGRRLLDSLYFGVTEKRDVLQGIIEKLSSGFKLSRIYKIDLAILMIAVYEILFLDDIPVKVSANEAVELAKKYSTDNSPAFINGILAAIIKDKENILNGIDGEDN